MAIIEKDISNEIEYKNSKGNPFGWTQTEIWHDGKIIGWYESGIIDIKEPGYGFTLTHESETVTRLTIYRAMDEEDWQAADFAKRFHK